jgi:UDP-glucuronate 4-epimerase
MQPGDVDASWASAEELIKNMGYTPATTMEEGIGKFVEWYLEFYEIKN